MDEVGGRWTFSRANEGYTSCGPVVEMSWHRVGALLLGGSVLPTCPGGSGRRWDWVVKKKKTSSVVLRKTAGSASEAEEAVKPDVKQE
uniref:Retroelement-like n=1 Tax=Oryza nivara TaxID=4536 RepID=A0A679BDU9_ORYNI|nr:retroelement-like [Oryza sativa f. spontanea]